MAIKNVLITGAAGFLGSHLMLHHLKQGDRVLGLDNFCSSQPNSDHAKMIRLMTSMPRHERSALVDCDISERDNFREAIEEFTCTAADDFDLIYNFACPASPPRYQEMPVLTMMTCVVGTEVVLDLASRHKAVLVHASTSEVYGDPDRSPQREDYKGSVNSYGPRSCYDEGKRAAEALCYDYLNSYEVDARLVRIFNTYGPHMDPYDGRVVSNFIRQALKGEKLTVYGGGTQSRSFCYVDDLIRGIVALGSLPENPRGPINIGNPNEFTIKQLAERVIMKIYGGTSFSLALDHMIVDSPLPIDDPLQRCPDISRATELLGWSPSVMLDDGLDKTIEYFRQAV